MLNFTTGQMMQYRNGYEGSEQVYRVCVSVQRLYVRHYYGGTLLVNLPVGLPVAAFALEPRSPVIGADTFHL